MQQQFYWCCHDGQIRSESSPGSFDECRLSARWPLILRPSQSTWAVSAPVGCCHPHHHHYLLLLLIPKADSILPTHLNALTGLFLMLHLMLTTHRKCSTVNHA